MLKKYLTLALTLFCFLPTAKALDLSAHSAVLLDQETGTILFEKNAHDPLPPASVTKVMTILLIMEALDQGILSPQEIVITSQNASSMGGSQVYLKQGETMEVWEMLKCVVVASANDCSVALAEHLHGTEENFVTHMNQKAQELGMEHTNFQNCSGLPAENHYTTAYDIALMSQALLKNHPQITQLSTIWMDSIRNGEFGLSNTNYLIHSYSGATGLKTGSTDQALDCISASATRDNLSLISVILKAPTSTERFQDAQSLLDYGFQTYTLQEIYPTSPLPPIPITLGTQPFLTLSLPEPAKILLEKSQSDQITSALHLPSSLQAPISQGDQIGYFHIYLHDTLLSSLPLYAQEEIPRLSIWQIFQNLFQIATLSKQA